VASWPSDSLHHDKRDTYSIVNSPPYKPPELVSRSLKIGTAFGIELTASTLNNDVFPAFCKPIIVMSISAALTAKKTH
jgi:hypothetical protein